MMGDMKVALVLVAAIFPFKLHAQSKKGQTGNSGQASLNVTATVEPSVSFTTNSEGKKELMVVNPPITTSTAKASEMTLAPIGKSAAIGKSAEKNAQGTPFTGRDSEVIFLFPDKTKEFDVTHQTVVMDVIEAGKTERRPVNVTTVVAR
jgi:hypothetical protein